MLFATLVLLTTMSAIAGALGAPLVPEIAAEYGVTLAQAQWSLTTTMLVAAASTPVLGRLSASRHRNAVVIAGLGAVTIGGLLCAFPLGFGAFLTGRGLQGFGYGLTPVAISIARANLPEAKRASAISLLSVTTVAGAGLGFPLASMGAEAWGLHRAFLVAALLCLATLVLSVVVLPTNPQGPSAPVDWIGTLLLSGGTTAALVGLAELKGLTPLLVIAAFVLAGLCVLGWLWWVRRTTNPIVDLALALRPVPLLAHVTSFLVGIGVYLLLPLITVVVQADGWGLGHGPAVAGWMIVPYSLMSVAASRWGLRLSLVLDRFLLLPLGCLTYLVAFVSITAFHDTLWQLAIGMLAAGTGSGLALAAIPGLLVTSVPTKEIGSSLAFNMVVRYLGFSIGSTLGLSALTFHGTPDARAFTNAMVVVCLVGVLMVAVTWFYAVRAIASRP